MATSTANTSSKLRALDHTTMVWLAGPPHVIHAHRQPRRRAPRLRPLLQPRARAVVDDAACSSTCSDSPIVTGGFACADLRRCPGVAPDSLAKPYSFLADVTTKDAPGRPGAAARWRPAARPARRPQRRGPPRAAPPAASAATRAPRARGSGGCRGRASAAPPPTAAAAAAQAVSSSCTSRSAAPSRVHDAAASCAPTGRSAPPAAAGAPASSRRAARRAGASVRPGGCGRGAYRVWSRGVDASGNVERKTRRRNFRPLRLRR